MGVPAGHGRRKRACKFRGTLKGRKVLSVLAVRRSVSPAGRNPAAAVRPASGFRTYSSGVSSMGGYLGYVRSASPVEGAGASFLWWGDDSVFTAAALCRAYGFSVRCVQRLRFSLRASVTFFENDPVSGRGPDR